MLERSQDILRKEESMPKRLRRVSNLEMDAYVNQLRRGRDFSGCLGADRAMLPPVTVQTQTESWTIRRVLTWTQQRFLEKGLQSPRLDAELLLSHCLGKPRVALYTCYDEPLSAEELLRYRGLIKQRLGGQPVAYLIEQKEFYGLTLRVTDAVLIPRPDTELLVDTALALLPKLAPSSGEPAEVEVDGAAADAEPADVVEVQHRFVPGLELTVQYEEPAAAEAEVEEAATGIAAQPAAAGLVKTLAARKLGGKRRTVAAASTTATVVDIGTGSGAVALTLKHERPDLRVLAVDKSDGALQVAQGNAERLQLAVEFFLGDLLTPLPPPLKLDMIVANLPYIPTADIAGLAADVRSEPHLALDGGPDGLDIIRRLLQTAPLRLRHGGHILLEIGQGQEQAALALLRDAGFVDTKSHLDLGHIPRVVVGRLP